MMVRVRPGVLNPHTRVQTGGIGLQAILAAEIQAGKNYTQRAVEADEFGDKGLAVQLEDMVRDEMGHSEESERMLRNWPM